MFRGAKSVPVIFSSEWGPSTQKIAEYVLGKLHNFAELADVKETGQQSLICTFITAPGWVHMNLGHFLGTLLVKHNNESFICTAFKWEM